MSEFENKFSAGHVTHIQPVETNENEWRKHRPTGYQTAGLTTQMLSAGFLGAMIVGGASAPLLAATCMFFYVWGTAIRAQGQTEGEMKTGIPGDLLKNMFKNCLPVPESLVDGAKYVKKKLSFSEFQQLS